MQLGLHLDGKTHAGLAALRKELPEMTIEKIEDLATYDASKVSDEVLRDDFRIALAWYATWKDDPGAIKFTREQIKGVLVKIVREAVKRGPDVMTFNPKGMKPAAREIFEEVARDVKVPEAMLKAVAVTTPGAGAEFVPTDPMDFFRPDILRDRRTEELEDAHRGLHIAFSQRAPGESIEPFVNAHVFLLAELERRGEKHWEPPEGAADLDRLGIFLDQDLIPL